MTGTSLPLPAHGDFGWDATLNAYLGDMNNNVITHVAPAPDQFSAAGALTVGTFTMRRVAHTAKTIANFYLSVGTAPTGSGLSVNLVKNGTTTVASGTIAAGANSVTGTVSSSALSVNDYLTITITAVGSTVAGSDLVAEVQYQ